MENHSSTRLPTGMAAYTPNNNRNTRYLTDENTLFTNETAPISAWSWWQKR
jgi:hypothetical protein